MHKTESVSPYNVWPIYYIQWLPQLFHQIKQTFSINSLIIIAIVWIIAILSTSPMLYITELTEAEYVDGSTVPVCLSRVQGLMETLYFFIILITFFALPFLILIVLYGLIAKNLVMDSRLICSSSEQYQMRLRKQVVFMLAAVMLSFFICLLPFRIFSLWILVVPQEKLNELGMEGMVYHRLLSNFLWKNSKKNNFNWFRSENISLFLQRLLQFAVLLSDSIIYK